MTVAPRASRRRAGAGALVLAAVTAALVAAACGSSGADAQSSTSHSAATAAAAGPSCLPATLNGSAKLAGTNVEVSPTPGTGTADPHTQISFLGAPASKIRDVTVVGGRSGRHAGQLRAYTQGDGASFVPAKPFESGEQVSVHAAIGGKPVSFAFGVDFPYSTAAVPSFPNPTAPPSDYQTFVTAPDVQAPILTVTTPDRDPAAGDILTSNGPGSGRYGALIYTPQGQLVWFDQLSGGLVADDVSVQTYEGQRDLALWVGRVPNLGFGQGKDVILNSHYQTVATIAGGNGLQADLHELQIEPNGVAYITAYNPIRCNLSSQQGPRDGVLLDDTVLEVDIKTGLVRWEWHALDHVNVSESQYHPTGTRAWDWIHLNSIDPEPDGDALISARNTGAVYQLQAGTGEILWRLGGSKSSFTGPGTKFDWQHDARVLADGELTIYDDSSCPGAGSQSRAMRVALDLKTHKASLVSAYTHNPPVCAASQGNVQTLADGNTVVGFGGSPVITEYGKGGSVLFDAHLPYDLIFYRAFRSTWTGRPLTPPVVVANLNNVGETIVHMSWNGATGVVSWRLLAGKRSGSLAPQITVGSNGFESSTILADDFAVNGKPVDPYVAVQALDSSGHVLGTSHTVAIESYAEADPVGRSSG
jgi:hypothetical protein